MSIASTSSEADILRRAMDSNGSGISVEFLSRVDFAADDHQQMRQLAAKARAGRLTADEAALLHHYEVVSDLLGILRSKARISLEHSGATPA
jgi:hypothetical protein